MKSFVIHNGDNKTKMRCICRHGKWWGGTHTENSKGVCGGSMGCCARRTGWGGGVSWLTMHRAIRRTARGSFRFIGALATDACTDIRVFDITTGRVVDHVLYPRRGAVGTASGVACGWSQRG